MATSSQFFIELEQEEDGRWIGEVPTLPGVMAYGPTRSEALAAVSFIAA
jgi:predicted RNase H-like HicB family nuclease